MQFLRQASECCYIVEHIGIIFNFNIKNLQSSISTNSKRVIQVNIKQATLFFSLQTSQTLQKKNKTANIRKEKVKDFFIKKNSHIRFSGLHRQ